VLLRIQFNQIKKVVTELKTI